MAIRPYAEPDAASIAELYNTHPENPNPVRGGITAEQFHRELQERGTAAFLVAEAEGRVIGTFGLFPTTGRVCAGAHETFADMFYVAPSHRKGTLTGQLFTAAIMWMIGNGLEVLRLTVNPANRDAFRLYRRVGCVSRGQLRPGADGNVELYCYVPLILKRIRDDIGEDNRLAIAGMNSFGCVLNQLADELDADTTNRDGRTVVDYHLDLGPVGIDATVDVDAAEVLSASVRNASGSRPLRLAGVRPEEPGDTAVLASVPWGRRTVDVEADGTLIVRSVDHWGPLALLTWPDADPHRAAGWRGGPRRALQVTPSETGLDIHDESTDVSCALTLDGDTLVSEFHGVPGETLRLFQQPGLRQAMLDADPVGDAPIRQAPAGLDLVVPDASQIAAAGVRLSAGTAVRWTEDAAVVEATGDGEASLVTSTLVDRRVTLGVDGTARLATRITAAPRSTPRRNAHTSWSGASGRPQLRLDAGAGGIVRWSAGDVRILHSPFPRVRRLACNPSWAAGLWVTREPDRHDRGVGMGWGLPHTDWVADGPNGLRSAAQALAWELDGDPLHTNWNLDLTTDNPVGEVAVWLTPAVAPTGQVRASSFGEIVELIAGGGWQRWTTRLGVELAGGLWLCIEPDLHQGGSPEIIVRSTGGELLIGCVTRASAGRARWRIALLDSPAGLVGRHSYVAAG